MTATYGLSTEQAFQRLKENIENEIVIHQGLNQQTWWNQIWQTFHWKNCTTVTWFGLIGIVLEIIVLLISLVFDVGYRSSGLSCELTILLLLTSLLVFSCLRESHLKNNEVERLISQLLEEADVAVKQPFAISGLPYLTLTETNSITLIWTYRDKRIVNLPCNLLVEGDVIILGPSRVAPADCRQISSINEVCESPITLEAGEMYNPSIETSHPNEILPHPRQRFEVLQSPVKSIIRSYLHGTQKKNGSILSKDTNSIIRIVETKLIWMFMVVSVFVNILRWQFLTSYVGDLIEMLLLIPIYTILPLLPITFPILFLLVTFYGTARLRILFATCSKFPSVVGFIEPEDIKLEHVEFRQAITSFWEIIRGNPDGLPRTVNFLHTLGTITTFCCVDKEGILCYTHPTAEKVFFFKDHAKIKRTHEMDNLLEPESNPFEDVGEEEKKGHAVVEEEELWGKNKDGTVINDVEILTISGDPKGENGIAFDDIDWDQQLPSLKPLGINMLLNSPCRYPMKSLRDEDFIRHLSLTANAHVVPNFVSCLCSLARKIGFEESVMNAYKNKQTILSFKQLHTSDNNVTSSFFLSIIKEKHVPFTVSSIIDTGNHDISQLLTQGSADLILETCSDVWNGEELCTLTDHDRKKALSFFQRMSITRRCVAFSYRPVFEEKGTSQNVDVKNQETNVFEDIFMEFSKDVQLEDSEDEEDDDDDDDKKKSTSTPKRNNAWMRRHQKDSNCDDLLKSSKMKTEDLQIHHKNTQKQIFLGMVTLTHTLKEDLITMVDQLNTAGVRFVHFSYENELLSRVFCQRLGLETGWNCHISLGDSSGTTTLMDDDDNDDDSSASESCPLLNEEDEVKATSKDIFSCGTSLIQLRQCSESFNRTDTDTSVCLANHEDHDDNDDDDVGSQSSQGYENHDELYFMSNRSKLPKGIHNMRQHLAEVDDVPLLVPLFTDCNPSAVSEMISIMQDYGDIVCCIGSVLNSRNHQLFTQSDITIALEPVWHDSCSLKQDGGYCSLDASVSDPDLFGYHQDGGLLSFSARLNSVTASLTCKRSENFPIAALVCERTSHSTFDRKLVLSKKDSDVKIQARRLTIGLRTCFLFLFSSHLSLSLFMLFTSLFLLPPPLTGCQLLWLMCVLLPLLSLSLIGTPADTDLMRIITGKRKGKRPKKEFIMPYVQQFVPPFTLNVLFICLVLYPWLLHSFCMTSSSNCHWMFGDRNKTSSWNGLYDDHRGNLYLAQDLILFYITLSFIILSVSFVHRTHLLWKKLPFDNKPWTIVVLVCGSPPQCLSLQLLYTISSITYWSDTHKLSNVTLADVSPFWYPVAFIWLVVMVGMNELLKRKYIRARVRLQKREKLKFDTKLGMNSPV